MTTRPAAVDAPSPEPAHDALTRAEHAPAVGRCSCGSWWARVLVLASGTLGVLVFAGGMSGCGEALIDDNQERSQYDRYDALRDQRPPAGIEDEFGNRKPNLRGRLLRRD